MFNFNQAGQTVGTQINVNPKHDELLPKYSRGDNMRHIYLVYWSDGYNADDIELFTDKANAEEFRQYLLDNGDFDGTPYDRPEDLHVEKVRIDFDWRAAAAAKTRIAEAQKQLIEQGNSLRAHTNPNKKA